MAWSPRPLRITVETTALDGTTVTTVYERGLARLIAHEIDHDGHLYLDRKRPGADPIPVEQYRQTGRSWAVRLLTRDAVTTGEYVDAEDLARGKVSP
ncbi:peptide deformylase [Streptomyces ehimensis]|uniref:Peptide deformylase n=1 Tax=Streptomyces ehimensis TaxID=68195 RepID=A0ABV9BQV2_9ACTN